MANLEKEPIIEAQTLDNGLILELRPLSTDDVEFYYNSVSNSKEHLRHFKQTVVDTCPNIDSAHNYISNPDRLRLRFGIWVVSLVSESKIYVGYINAAINKVGSEAEIGYWLDKDYQGNGYATMAVIALVNYLIENCKSVKRIFAKVVVGNFGSEKVLERSGFMPKGSLKEPPKDADQLEPVKKRVYEYPIIST